MAPEAKTQSPSAGAEGTLGREQPLGPLSRCTHRVSSLNRNLCRFLPKEKELVFPFAKHELSIGYVDNYLEVFTDDTTQIAIGDTSTSLFALMPGMRVIVAGMTEEKSLRAATVSDLSSIRSVKRILSIIHTEQKS